MTHHMPFGRYKGDPVWSVPSDYLGWMLRTCKLSTGLRQAVRAELHARGELPPGLAAEPAARPPRCGRCGGADLDVYWQELGGAGGRSIRAECRACRRFVAFLPMTPENTARADLASSPTGLLDVLTAAEAEGVEIVSRGHWLALIPPGRASAELERLVRQNTRGLLRHLLPAGEL
jgi:hypothetical protein